MRELRICGWAALISLLVTAIVPVLFFRFPGPEVMPLPYETMWAITEVLWKPLRIIQFTFDPVVPYDLIRDVNRFAVAPFVNAILAFCTVYGFFKLRDKWRRRSRKARVDSGLASVVDHVEEVRTDFPTALHRVPHPTAHAEGVLQEARAKVAAHPYFQEKTEAEASREDDKRE